MQERGSAVAATAQPDVFLFRAHALAALVTLLLSVLFGTIVSLQFILPDFAQFLPSWGRLRYAHTQGIMLGWLGNAFLAFLYYAVPVLSGRPVRSHVLGLCLFGLWNFAVMLPGWLLLLAGVSQPLEWAEFPLPVDVVVMLALLVAALQFLPAFFRRGFENLYVSSWYIIGALVFTLLSYPMGNIVPEFVPGAAGAAFSGLWIHDAVGLFVTPLALAILYFVIPASTGRPIYSHFLSMLGFWGLFFLYPLNGIHHYIHSVIPMAAQSTAILASFLLGVVVIIVVSNLVLSQRGSGLLPADISLRFASVSVLFYLVVSIQGSLQANMQLNAYTHFSDWVIGHSHLAMLGFATLAGAAGIVHAWQRLPGCRCNPLLLNWSYWLLVVGISVMVIDLTLAGLVQGDSWQAGEPWLESLRASQPYWIVRSVSAVPVLLGFLLLLLALISGPASAATAAPVSDAASSSQADSGDASGGRVLAMSYLVASVAGVLFFVLSVSLLGLMPWQSLQQQSVAMGPEHTLRLSPAELRGREIYAREGCSYCHTQQIRYVEADIERFGAPTLAWEGRLDYPHMLGTRRIGPDLSRAGGTRSADWHLAHLFAPRSVVPLSVMPAYPEFFDGSPLRPKQEALDILAYLETLGRARELAWPEADLQARAAAAGDEQALMSLTMDELNRHPARTRPRGDAPGIDPGLAASALDSGAMLWRENCSGCHGVEGLGDGPAAEWLRPQPINLSQHRYTRDMLADILWNGVHGTSMPGWRDRSEAELAALMAMVQEFSEVEPSTQTSMQLTQGAEIYARHCAECHGDNGAGDGFAASSLPQPAPPTDFTREQLSMAESLRVLREGVTGTSMAPWTERLNANEMTAVAQYLRSLFRDDSAESSADD